jgi:hypothetical protein
MHSSRPAFLLYALIILPNSKLVNHNAGLTLLGWLTARVLKGIILCGLER